MWVTDTRAEIDFAAPDQTKRGWVWAVDIDSGAKELVLESGPVFINGLGFTPDGDHLMVTTTSSAQLWSYPVARDGRVSGADGEILCTFENGWPDGMAVRADGASWVALTGGHRLDLVDPVGEILDSAVLPDRALPTNVCIDTHSKDLLVTASFHEARLRVTV